MLTNDDMDDLVEEWHEGYWEDNLSLTSFLCLRTGLTYDQIVHWIETGQLPKER